MLIKTQPDPLEHRTVVPHIVPPDEPVVYRWHFSPGILKPRMSALELAGFVLSLMPSILPMFSHQPTIYNNFLSLMTKFATTPTEVLDEVLPWVQSSTRGKKKMLPNGSIEEEDDIIVLDLNAKYVPGRTQTIFY